MKPIMRLDHLVKERYPRFIDALRDLDDCLSMIHLFATLPSVGRITAEKTKTCHELARHWQYYIARTRSLRKVFVSVKGVYFQVNILGESITWLTPHPFAQAIPRDVDMRVMVTFLEFYEVFLRFTLFKLYHMQGLQYPPKTDKLLHDAGCVLLSIRATSLDGSNTAEALAITDTTSSETHDKKLKAKKLDPVEEERMKSLNAKLESIVTNVEEEDEDDEDDEGPSISGPLSESLQGLFPNENSAADEKDAEEMKVFTSSEGAISSYNAQDEHKLFSKYVFFINREVPLDWMQLCIISFGGLVGWEGSSSPYSINDPAITHHIVDRPIQGQQNMTREYIQPQWVFDCINAQMLLPVQRYAPGATLPPHLSPFVDDEKEGYIPKYRDELLKMKSSAEVIDESASKKESKLATKEALDDDDEEEDEDDEVDEKEEEEEEEKTSSVQRKNGAAEEHFPSSVNAKGPKAIVHKPVEKKQSEVSYHVKMLLTHRHR
jgi:pescadillo